MEIDKTLILPAPPERVWRMLLDPQAMAHCVPGMQSVQVITPDEYTAEMVTKVSFITARMKLRTRIVQRDEPKYLKAEGTGEDRSVASSLKQTTEMHLEALPNRQSQLRLNVKVDVVGRLATFGLSALKTKADRLWDEFGQNLVKYLHTENDVLPAVENSIQDMAPASAASETPLPTSMPASTSPLPVSRPTVKMPAQQAPQSWWQRLFGADTSSVIVVDWQRPDGSRVQVQWPVQQADACVAWLNQLK
jgi:uncharacterized protein